MPAMSQLPPGTLFFSPTGQYMNYGDMFVPQDGHVQSPLFLIPQTTGTPVAPGSAYW